MGLWSRVKVRSSGLSPLDRSISADSAPVVDTRLPTAVRLMFRFLRFYMIGNTTEALSRIWPSHFEPCYAHLHQD